MNQPAQKTEPDDGLTAGERAYMQGGSTEGLAQEGVTIEQPAPQPVEAPTAPADATAPPATPPVVDDDDDQPELDPTTGKPKKRGGWISKKAFDAEREERKRIAQELGSTRENWARLEERFKVFQEAALATAPQQEPTEQPLPDPEQDVFGYLKAIAERSEKRFSALDQRLGQVHEGVQARDESSELVTTYANDARRFAQNQPDFGHAYRWLMANRDAELQAAGYDDPNERLRLIAADEQAIVRKTLQARGSPAERVYALARARGYAPPAAPQAAAPGGAPAAAAPAPGARPTAAEEIARVQAGQNASLSLSNVGGGRPNNMSIIDLVNMPDEEFRQFARKNPNLLEQMAGK